MARRTTPLVEVLTQSLGVRQAYPKRTNILHHLQTVVGVEYTNRVIAFDCETPSTI